MADAPRAGQRVVHIAGHFIGMQPGARPGPRRRCAPAVPAGAARCQLLACSIQQLHAQGLQHACAAISGGAAANAQNQVVCTGIQRSGDQLTRAIAGGHARIALGGGTMARPLAAAISIMAVRPSPVRP